MVKTQGLNTEVVKKQFICRITGNIMVSKRVYLLGVLLMLCMLLYFSLFPSKKNNTVQVVIRYDDYSNTSSIETEREMLKLVDMFNFPLSLGIIPYTPGNKHGAASYDVPLSQAKVDLIRNYVKKGLIEICQHGYSHSSVNRDNPYSEFTGMSYNLQYHKILKGKKLLDSLYNTRTITFIPPWNAYDQTTVKVLAGLHFKNLSSDNFGVVPADEEIIYLPYTAELPHLEKIMKYKYLPGSNGKAMIVLMLHEYNFKEKNSDRGVTSFGTFEHLIKQMTDRRWQLTSIQKITRELKTLNHHRYLSNHLKLLLISHIDFLSKYLPPYNKITILNHFYTSGRQNCILCILVVFHYMIVILLSSLVFTFMFRSYFHKRSSLEKFRLGISFMVILLLIYFIVNDHLLGRNETLLISMLTGFVAHLYSGQEAADW
jgi:hypothetical protein